MATDERARCPRCGQRYDPGWIGSLCFVCRLATIIAAVREEIRIEAAEGKKHAC